MHVDNISFKSRILFVDAKTFEKVKRGNYIPWGEYTQFIQKANEFYTDSIRTCTAGALINTKTAKAIGFHVHDCLENFRNINEYMTAMIEYLKPDKCLIIGGKKYISHNPFSLPIFSSVKKQLGKNIENITVFERHVPVCSESDLFYSMKEDAFYIHSHFLDRQGKNHRVSSEEELKKCFKRYRISQDDELIFQ